MIKVGDWVLLTSGKIHQIQDDDIGSHWIGLCYARHLSENEVELGKPIELRNGDMVCFIDTQQDDNAKGVYKVLDTESHIRKKITFQEQGKSKRLVYGCFLRHATPYEICLGKRVP